MSKRSKQEARRVRRVQPIPVRPVHAVGLLGRLRRRTVPVVLGAIFLLTLAIAAWPQLTLMFSSAKPAVTALSNDVVYVGPGAAPLDTNEIRGIVGTRPVALIDLASTDPTADDPLDLCSKVTDRLDDILVMMVVDGESKSGCEGDALPIVGDRDTFDFAFWLGIQNSTTFLDGDVARQTQQLALQYDSEVTGGTLTAATRSYRTPLAQLLLAVGIAVGVVVAVLLAFTGLRRSAAMVVRRRERQRAWLDRFDDLESQVSAVALDMVGPRSDLQAVDEAQVQQAGLLAQQYLSVLQKLENTRLQADLGEVAAQVSKLVAAAGGKR